MAVEHDTCPRCSFSALDNAPIPTSPHPELLLSSVIPSDLEAASIRTTIDTAEQGILALDDEMVRLARALNECSARRRALKEFVLVQRAPLSLLRTLPHELLGEIFMWCRDDSGDLHRDPRRAVTRVCSTWRAVALSTPRMW
ncbi:hypothetical protein C8R44DRAFT_632840, partial [Mycena epipterygia]